MIKPLRKRHLQIWSVLLVLIPAGIVTAGLSVKKPVYNGTLQPPPAQAFSRIMNSVKKKNYTVRLRGDESGARQLEWINEEPLTVPSALIYKTRQGHHGIESADLLGRIEAKGTYYFPLNADSSNMELQFVLYDFIHEKIIDSIKF